MDKIITIVIPTYNMEKYLDKCLASLILPKMLMDSIEVLVINDGSKDRSSEIAHGYESRYPQSFRVIDKENGNYGSCINCGLREAAGKYIKVLDADDYFNTKAWESFIISLEQIDVDIVVTDMSYFDGIHEPVRKSFINISPNIIYKLDANKPLNISKLMMHIVCYKVKILRDSNYFQTESISYTDQEWIFYPFFFVRSMIYLQEDLYHYLIGRTGQTMNFQTMIRNVDHNKIIATRAFDFYRQFDKKILPPTNAIEIKRQIIYQFSYLYNIYLKQQGKNYDRRSVTEIDTMLKEDALLYKEVGKKLYHRWLPIRYILIWRITGKRFNLNYIHKIFHLRIRS